MVQTHGSVQLSLGAAMLLRVIEMSKKMIARIDDEEGNPHTTITKSVKDVLMAMIVDDRKIWQCISRSTNGRFTGYFDSVEDNICKEVEDVAKSLGAAVFWFLMRKGAVQEDVVKLIKRCFTLTEQQKCTRSRYSTSRGCIVDDLAEKDIINSVKKSGAFDMTHGLSEKEKKIHTARYGVGKWESLSNMVKL